MAWPPNWNSLISVGALPPTIVTSWNNVPLKQRLIIYPTITFLYPAGGTASAPDICFLILVESPGSQSALPPASLIFFYQQILTAIYTPHGSELGQAMGYWNALTQEQQCTFAYYALTVEGPKDPKNFSTIFPRVTTLNALKVATTGIPYGVLSPATNGHHTVRHKKPAVLTPAHVPFGTLASLSPAKPPPAHGGVSFLAIVVGAAAVALVYFSVE
jgi:hypothetical protein